MLELMGMRLSDGELQNEQHSVCGTFMDGSGRVVGWVWIIWKGIFDCYGKKWDNTEMTEMRWHEIKCILDSVSN